MKLKLITVLLGFVVIGLICSSSFTRNDTEQNSISVSTIKQVKPYLMFPGTCRQALKFYKKCFNGTIVMMKTFGESSIDVPEELENRIFNSELRAGNLSLMASDHLPNNEVTVGSNVALFVIFSEKAEKEKVFTKLSEGGRILFPIENNFGMVADKFGIQWMMEHRN